MPKNDLVVLMISFDFLKRRSTGPQKLVSKSGHKYSVLESLKKILFFNLENKTNGLEKKMKNEIFGVMKFL